VEEGKEAEWLRGEEGGEGEEDVYEDIGRRSKEKGRRGGGS